MAGFCLVPQGITKFKAALRDGSIDPYKLNHMTSEERRKVFHGIAGDENAAKEMNASFESRMLLKNQKTAYTNWARKLMGVHPEVRRDLLSRIQKMDHVLAPTEEKAFLQDLASSKLGVNVTSEEAKNISELSGKVTSLEAKAKEDGSFASADTRLAYGAAKHDLEDYMSELKLASQKTARNTVVKKAGYAVKETPGFLKSAISTLDNSFFGRQGVSTLFNPRTTHIWVKNFAKSWGDIGKELVGKDALRAVKSDIYSRPNALNGKYRAGNYGLDVMTEEAYPSHALAKIPILKRLYKASESAYNGGALRMRADLADKFIHVAEKQGINTLDKEQARGIGTLIGEMTGRGSLNSRNSWTNSLLFSPKFLKANFDRLTLHTLDKNATAFTKKEAAKNLAGIVGTTAALLGIADKLMPGSVDWDPRSSHFGKIKVAGNWVDVTGGSGALLTLAARTMVPTRHNGTWGLYSKSGANVSNLLSRKYGANTALDIVNNFWEGKLAPAPGILRDVWTQDTYQGTRPTVKGEVSGATIPLSIQTYSQLKDNKNSSALAGIIADGLGFSVTTPNNKNAVNQQNLPKVAKPVLDTLNDANYQVPEFDSNQRKQDLSSAQFKQFKADTSKRFVDAVNKARNDPTYKSYAPGQKKRSLQNSMTKAKNQALDDIGVKKAPRATSVKSY